MITFPQKKNIFLVFSFIAFFASHSFIYSQARSLDRLPEGYISTILNTAYGIVFSDEYNSTLYLNSNGKTEKLLSAPGCGRYVTINNNGNKIGFKLIDAVTGLQTPAVYDLKNKTVVKLEASTQNAGQVSFANDGSIAYTYETNFIVVKNGIKKSFDLGVYSNRSPISPDGSKAIYRDNNDQLWSIDLTGGTKNLLTDQKDGYSNAVWAPDSKSIVYTTNGIKIFSTDLTDNKTYYIGEGEAPSFTADSKQIIYYNKDINYNKVQLVNSDIYIAGSKGEYTTKLTNTTDVLEMEPVFDALTNKVLYHTFDKMEIRSLQVSNLSKPLTDNLELKITEPLKVEFFTKEMSLQKIAGEPNEPNYIHIHQVYDTREDWDEGRSCCGATSCMEAIASYGILPPSPITTYSHVSNYGKYISDPYTFSGYTFTGYIGWPSGGHGFLWNGSDSPYSNSVNYLKRHGIDSYRNENVSFSTVTNELNNGYPFIVCSTGLTAGHIVMVVGQFGTGHTLYCNDPYGDKNVGSYGYIRNGKNAIYDWSDVNTGRYKVTPVVWAVTARCNPNVLPTISSTWPLDNAADIKTVDTISIMFNQIMDKASVEAAFSISPSVAGTFFWTSNDQTINFKPAEPLNKLTKYTVTLKNSAKNYFGKSFDKNIVFSFTTRSRYKLAIEKSYPSLNQVSVSTTAQFRIQFDAPILYSGLVGKVELFNANNEKLSLASVKVSTVDGKGAVAFEAKSPLAPNSMYYILLNSKIADAEGIMLLENVRIPFITDAEKYQSGTVVDDFESIANWAIQSSNGGSTGIDTLATFITLATDKKVNGSSSAKAAYTFSSSNGICKIDNSKKPAFDGATSSEFGIWVFGDWSRNILKYRFTVGGNETEVAVDTLNWTGWKLKRIPLSAITGTGNKAFSGISICQTAAGSKSGALYFDDAQYNVVVGVNSGSRNIQDMYYALYQNYPNPFNPSTSISYLLGSTTKVMLKVYDVLGKEVATLVNDVQTAGTHTVEFSTKLSSGIYYYTLRAGEFTSTRKMIILK